MKPKTGYAYRTQLHWHTNHSFKSLQTTGAMLQAIPKNSTQGKSRVNFTNSCLHNKNFCTPRFHQHMPKPQQLLQMWIQHTNRDCPAIGQRCHKCNGMNHFSVLCRSRNYRDYRDYDRQSRHCWRKPHKSRSSSISSSHDSSRSNSRSRHHKSPQHTNRYRRSPTPFNIHSITTSVQEPTEAANTDSEDKPVSKCKDRCPTPLLFNFSDFNSSTCDELAFSDMEACSNYTDFLPS